MKHFYQLLAVITAGTALVACDHVAKNQTETQQSTTANQTTELSNPQQALKADLVAFDQATSQNGNLAEIQTLQSDLQNAKTPEEQADIFKKIADKYQSIKDSVSSLDVKTDEGKKIQESFNAGFGDFIQLMQLSAKYVVNKPTEEQAKSLVELQQKATQKLTQATQMIEEAKAKVAEGK